MLRTMLQNKVVRFLVSGGTSACVEYGTFFLLQTLIHIGVIPANIISFCCGLGTSFLLNKFWVFGAKDKATYKRELVLFVILGVTNLIITTVLIKLLSLYVPALLAKFILMGCVAVWNYAIFQRIIFRVIDPRSLRDDIVSNNDEKG